nr:reverse transcriptase domain-containing protein [Tanacetum cinerariifolium]
MRTRSSSNLPGESSSNPTSSNPKRHNRRRSKQHFILEESPVDTMADQRTMAELLRAPTEGYVEAIVVPPILVEQFELKHNLINMMTSNQFFVLEKDNPHDHIRMNQQHEQEALLAAQRDQELREQEQAAQEKEEPPQNSKFCQLIGEMCGTKVYEEQKQNIEDTMLELLEYCRQKELYYTHNDVEDLIKSALNSKLLSINLKFQRLDKEKQEIENITEQVPKPKTRLMKCLKNFKVIHNESIIPLNNTSQVFPVIANTSDIPTKEPEYSLSMEDEHLSTILETESDEVIKSSVKNLVPIPSEFEVTSDNESECDKPVNDESSPIFTMFSNLIFDCNDDFTSSDDKSLSNEGIPMENFKIYSNPLFDDEEIISTKIEEADFDLEKFDSDSHMEEIDLFLITDYLMPPAIENNDYDLEGDVYFLEELLSSDPLPLPENESSNFDHHDNPNSQILKTRAGGFVL